MKQLVTSKGLKIIAVLTVLAAVAVWFLVQQFGYPRQRANMAAADKHIPILLPMLQKDSRFTNITVHTFTGANGSLFIAGELPAESDLRDLKQMVEASKPPVAVVYHVDIIPPELLQELSKPKSEGTPK
jgi:hypothetical protein